MRGLAGVGLVSALLMGCVPTDGANLQTQGGGSLVARSFVGPGANVLTPHGHRFVSAPSRAGGRAERFELRHDDCAVMKSRAPLDCSEDRQRIEREEDPRGTFQRYGTKAWYGWSVYVPTDFPSLAPASVTVVQAKPPTYNPLWEMNLGSRPRINFWDDREGCSFASLNAWKGRWVDIVAFADYQSAPEGAAFQLWVDGELSCTRRAPLITEDMPGDGNRLHMRYGLYQAYISRWLAQNGQTPAGVTSWRDVNSQPGFASSSPTPTPFAYDWGIELPPMVIYFDEFRSGPTRESVDISMRP